MADLSTAPSGPLDPLRERAFVAFWSTGAVSSSANWMLGLSVPVIVYGITGSETLLGTVAVAQNLPSLFGSPLGGAWSDRHSKRLVLLGALVAQIVLTAALCEVSREQAVTVTNLMALAAAIGFASSVNLSAYQSLIADIVPEHQLRPAYRLNAIQFNLSRAIGPAIAGVVLSRWGPTAAFAINALAHLSLVTVLCFLRPRQSRPTHASPGVLAEILEGARVARGHPALRIALLTVSTSAAFGMSVQQLAAGLSREVFHVDEAGLGLLVSAVGLSAVATAIASVWLADRFRDSATVRVGLVVYGLGLLVVAATDSFAVGLAGFAITGFAHVLVNVSVTTAVQVHVPNAYRARVTSLQLMGIILSMAFGAQLGGALAEATDLPTVVAAYGGVLIGFAAWGQWRMQAFRAID
ncbi:MAG TPA: MFS transporter [Myxococcota bacterium]|nr:MFS transporter [Myxococcota bacterium]